MKRTYTCVYDLADAGVWRDEQNQVIKWNGTNQVQNEPRLQVVLRYLSRLQNDLVRKIIRYYTCDRQRAEE